MEDPLWSKHLFPFWEESWTYFFFLFFSRHENSSLKQITKEELIQFDYILQLFGSY